MSNGHNVTNKRNNTPIVTIGTHIQLYHTVWTRNIQFANVCKIWKQICFVCYIFWHNEQSMFRWCLDKSVVSNRHFVPIVTIDIRVSICFIDIKQFINNEQSLSIVSDVLPISYQNVLFKFYFFHFLLLLFLFWQSYFRFVVWALTLLLRVYSLYSMQ